VGQGKASPIRAHYDASARQSDMCASELQCLQVFTACTEHVEARNLTARSLFTEASEGPLHLVGEHVTLRMRLGRVATGMRCRGTGCRTRLSNGQSVFHRLWTILTSTSYKPTQPNIYLVHCRTMDALQHQASWPHLHSPRLPLQTTIRLQVL
jgi:hypothetical protein